MVAGTLSLTIDIPDIPERYKKHIILNITFSIPDEIIESKRDVIWDEIFPKLYSYTEIDFIIGETKIVKDNIIVHEMLCKDSSFEAILAKLDQLLNIPDKTKYFLHDRVVHISDNRMREWFTPGRKIKAKFPNFKPLGSNEPLILVPILIIQS